MEEIKIMHVTDLHFGTRGGVFRIYQKAIYYRQLNQKLANQERRTTW